MSDGTIAIRPSRVSSGNPVGLPLVVLLITALILVRLTDFDYRNHLPDSVLSPDEIFFMPDAGVRGTRDVDRGLSVTLPHRWRSTHRQSVGWYTAMIRVYRTPERPWAIYLPDVTIDSTIYLNDRVIGDALGPAEARGSSGRRPLYLPVPPGTWRIGENELRIRVNATPESDEWLDAFHVGMDAALGQTYAKHVLHEVEIPMAIGGLLAFAALVMAVIWQQLPSGRGYGWFAAVCGSWALLCSAHVIDPAGWLPANLAWSEAGSLLLLTLCMSRFVADAASPDGASWRRTKILLTVTALASFLAFSVGGPEALETVLWIASLAQLVEACATVLRSGTGGGRVDRWILRLSLVTLTLVVAIDVLALLPFTPRAVAGGSLSAAAPLFVAFVGWRLIRDLVRSGNALEALNRDLEARIAQRTAALERQHERLRSLERDRTLSLERDRIMLEMHDGMGAHLVSLLAMAEGGNIDPTRMHEAVSDALQDLRLMIDSLDPVDNDLGFVLGMYRQRVARQLDESDVRVVWSIADTPRVTDLTPNKVLQILRIVQEAVSNALKHSRSKRIRITVDHTGGAAWVEIRDEGIGMNARPGSGRGLSNMRRRAASIGATIDMGGDRCGFVVRLALEPVPISARSLSKA